MITNIGRSEIECFRLFLQGVIVLAEKNHLFDGRMKVVHARKIIEKIRGSSVEVDYNLKEEKLAFGLLFYVHVVGRNIVSSGHLVSVKSFSN